LTDSDYRGKPKVPRQFDVIDTSNLADYLSSLNLLIAAGPLLKNATTSSLHLELLLRKGHNAKETFDTLLCGYTQSLSLMLGLMPLEFWTNATADSNVEEVLMAVNAEDPEERVHAHARLIWKPSSPLTGQETLGIFIKMTPVAVATVLMAVYQDIFEFENLEAHLNSSFRAKRPVHDTYTPRFHRGSFAVLLKVLTTRIDTKWPATIALLLEMIQNDQAVEGQIECIQELIAYLSILDLYHHPLLKGLATGRHFCDYRTWDHIPEVLSATFVVPRQKLNNDFAMSSEQEASPDLMGSV
jgi:hypothetical protein